MRNSNSLCDSHVLSVRIVDPADEHWEAGNGCRRCVLSTLQRIAGMQLDSIVKKQIMDYDLDQHCREMRSDAFVCARTERNEGKTVRPVLTPCFAEPLGIECVRVRPQARPVVIEPHDTNDHRVF